MALNAVPVPLAPYAPDMSDYNPQFSDAILNVEPHAVGYGPLRGWAQSLTSTLPAQCRGAITVRLASGSTAIYAGTATRLYKLNPTNLTWDNVSRVSAVDYAVATGTYWSFCQFGSYLIACNGVDATQFIDVDVGTNFAALSNAPIARYVATLGDCLLLMSLSTDYRAIAWSGVNDATSWTPGYRGSDIQVFPDGGEVMGGVPYQNGAVVFQKDKIRLIEYVGGNYIWGIRIIHDNNGCFAPNSICSAHGTFFWYSQNGFHKGLEGQMIGAERVDRFVEENADASKLARVRATVDPSKNLVWWTIDKPDSTTLTLGYDFLIDKWTRADFGTDYTFPAISPGYTIDGMATLGYTTIDSLPYPADSPFWQGTGIQTLAGFSSSGAFGYFQDDYLPATLETVDIEFSKGGASFANAIRLETDCADGCVSGQLGVRRFPGRDIEWTALLAADADTGRIWARAMGSTMRLRFAIEEGGAWNNADSATIWLRKAGARA